LKQLKLKHKKQFSQIPGIGTDRRLPLIEQDTTAEPSDLNKEVGLRLGMKTMKKDYRGRLKLNMAVQSERGSRNKKERTSGNIG